MKYFASLLIAVPLVASCTVIQEDYYRPGYDAPPPPHYHSHVQYRQIAQSAAYHAHAPVHRARPNTHGHRPVVRHSGTRAGTVQTPANTHGHVAKPNVHGRHPGTPVQVPSSVHGHQ